VTSANRASVAILDACKIIDHSLASVCRATEQVADIAVIGGEVSDRRSLAFAARFDLAASINIHQLEILLVSVGLASDRLCRVGRALRFDHEAGDVQHFIAERTPAIAEVC